QVAAPEVVEPTDTGGVAGGDGELQAVGGERDGLADGTLVDEVGHDRLVGGGDDVGGRAVQDLLPQRRGAREAQLDGDAGVLVLERGGDVGEGVGERGRGEHGD